MVLDEFPELLRTTPELDGALRAIWERVEGTCQLRLVLCGSAVRSMEALQAQDAPLYNRMTLRLQVHPFHPHEVGRMLPDATPVDRARAWGVCGGLPFYLSAWDTTACFRENIAALFCDEHSLLLDEGEFVLATEDITGARRERLPEQVLRAIAGGRTRFGEIRSVLNTLPTRTLADLKQLRLIERVTPVTEKPSTKLSYYRIADNFLAFWLAVIERHRPAIEQGLGESVVDVVVEEFDDYMGARWEMAVREHISVEAVRGAFGPGIVAVGEYWRTRVGPTEDPCQLDVLALSGRQRRVAVVGEVTWARRQQAPRLLADLRRTVATAGLPLADSPTWLVCAREEVADMPSDGLAVTAHEVFAQRAPHASASALVPAPASAAD